MSTDLEVPLEHSRGYWTVGVRPVGVGVGLGDPTHLVPNGSSFPGDPASWGPATPNARQYVPSALRPPAMLADRFSPQVPPYLREYAHSGPTLQVFAERSFRIRNSDFFLVPQPTLDYRMGLRNYERPGGGVANSQFHAIGGGGNLLLRYVPPIAPLKGRLQIDGGLGASAAALITPSNTYETVAVGGGQVCYDSGAGRQQCEESAGNRQTNAGATGLLDHRVGASRNAEGGVMMQGRIPMTVHYEIPVDPILEVFKSPIRNTGASITPELTLQPDVSAIVPRKGTGGLVVGLTAMGGVSGRFDLPTP